MNKVYSTIVFYCLAFYFEICAMLYKKSATCNRQITSLTLLRGGKSYPNALKNPIQFQNFTILLSERHKFLIASTGCASEMHVSNAIHP